MQSGQLLVGGQKLDGLRSEGGARMIMLLSFIVYTICERIVDKRRERDSQRKRACVCEERVGAQVGRH